MWKLTPARDSVAVYSFTGMVTRPNWMAPFHIERATGVLQVGWSGCRQDRGPPGRTGTRLYHRPQPPRRSPGRRKRLHLRHDDERVDLDPRMRQGRPQHADRDPVVPARGPGTRQRDVPGPHGAGVRADGGDEGAVDVDLRLAAAGAAGDEQRERSPVERACQRRAFAPGVQRAAAREVRRVGEPPAG